MTIYDTLSLGELIDGLKPVDGKLPVWFRFCWLAPAGIRSYRGYYDHLAIGYSDDSCDVATLLELLEGAIGKHFEGYKGGGGTASRDTPVWIANWGNSGERLVRVVLEEDAVYLETEKTED